jgi:hypothetical protein
MTSTTTDDARFIELDTLFNSKNRAFLYSLLNKLGSGYDAGLACLDAVLQHRVYTMSTIARTANLQGFNMNAAGATIQLGRITKALAEAAGMSGLVEEYARVHGEDPVSVSFLAVPVGGKTINTCMRGRRFRDNEIVWALRPGYCY